MISINHPAFEFLDGPSFDLVTQHMENTSNPLEQSYPFFAVVETSGMHMDHDIEVRTRDSEMSFQGLKNVLYNLSCFAQVVIVSHLL